MTNDLKKQQAIWYKKLKNEGFKDIEDPSGPRNGGRNASYSFEYISMNQYEATRDYYLMCSQFLNEHKFDNVKNRIIWEYHAEGHPVREISKILKKEHNIKLGKSAIWQRVKKIEKLMFDKYMDKK